MPLLTEDQLAKVDGWLRSVLWDGHVPGIEARTDGPPLEIHRLKARLTFHSGAVKMVQGVREVFDMFDGEKVTIDETTPPQPGKVVLIGRGVKQTDFAESFAKTVGL